MLKDGEKPARALLQPHTVYVAEGHFRYRIDHVPQSLDPEVLVATLTSDAFKQYLVSAGRGTIVIAAPAAPPDIVFCIEDCSITLVLQLLPTNARNTLPTRPAKAEDVSPRRKARRHDIAATAQPSTDVKGVASPLFRQQQVQAFG